MSEPELLPAEVAEYVETLRNKYGVASFGLAVVSIGSPPNSSISSSKVFCTGQATADGRPLTPDSLFPIASNSKLFCALAIGLLVHRQTPLPSQAGKVLTWRTKIKDVLDWRIEDKYAQDNLDVVDLLSMQSGLPRHDLLCTPTSSAQDVLGGLEYCGFSDEPRKSFQYNNNHYALLSLFPEKLLGTSYDDFLEENVFRPLGMKGATFSHGKAKDSGRAVHGFYTENWDQVRLDEEVTRRGMSQLNGEEWFGRRCPVEWYLREGVEAMCFQGGGGLIMSLEDTVKWMHELLSPSHIPVEVLEKLAKPVSPVPESRPHPLVSHDTYALGQNISTYRGHKVLHHGGDVTGYASLIVRLPDKGLACTVFANDDAFGPVLCKVIARRWMDAVLRLEPYDWEGWEMGEALKLPKDQFEQQEGEAGIDMEEQEQVSGSDLEPWIDIAGEYHHPAYPTLRIRSERDAGEFPIDHEVLVERCRLMGRRINLDGEVYIASINAIFSSHVMFTPLGTSGRRWRWTLISVHSKTKTTSDDSHGGEGSEGSQGPAHKLVRVGAEGQALLVPSGDGRMGGLAMFDGWWGAYSPGVPRRDISAENPREACEVWYDKVL